MLNASLVLTTISDPVVLQDYFRNFKTYDHVGQVQTILIPDLKTPRAAFDTCDRLRNEGLRVLCPTVDQQNDFLRSIGIKPDAVLCNSDHRRNIGYLLALESGSDFLISIDDDNYCRDGEDFFQQHAVVTAGPQEHDIATADSGFVNACELLDLDPAVPVYPRGFPYCARFPRRDHVIAKGMADVMINAGLWLHDPDVDAMTWLSIRPRAIGTKGQSIVLDRGSWCPVNTQNTAVRANVIPAYYFIRMGYTAAGASVDRYGDIFSGYFAQACVKHLGGAVRFGAPIAEHRRNSHNYMRDAIAEWLAVLVIEDMAPWLRELQLTGSSPVDAYESLIYSIDDVAETFRGAVWTDTIRGFLHQMAHYMRVWLAGCRTLLGVGVA